MDQALERRIAMAPVLQVVKIINGTASGMSAHSIGLGNWMAMMGVNTEISIGKCVRRTMGRIVIKILRASNRMTR